MTYPFSSFEFYLIIVGSKELCWILFSLDFCLWLLYLRQQFRKAERVVLVMRFDRIVTSGMSTVRSKVESTEYVTVSTLLVIAFLQWDESVRTSTFSWMLNLLIKGEEDWSEGIAVMTVA